MLTDPYQDEEKAQQDFDAGKCDAVATSIRARKYNKFTGSVDAIGAVNSNAIAKKPLPLCSISETRRIKSNVGGEQ